jgi:glycosyltransferase involved in cell wall biosynthesis
VKKNIVCFFLRKPVYGKFYSIEKYFYELINNHYDNRFVFKLKICPVESKGLFNRIYLIFWAYFNQGDINHICGDIHFIALFLKKSRTIITVHDNYSMKRLHGIKRIIYYIFWLKLPAFRCCKIIAVSKKTADELKKYLPNIKSKILHINVFIQSIFKKKFKKKSNLTSILIIGTAINKNFYNSISSLSKIKCEVSIIGILNSEQIKFLKDLNIKYRNFFNLSDHQIYKKYCYSDILLFASTYEGFGMPILEAQAVGRPVVTSNIRPLTDVGGEGALYVNPNSINSITKGVQTLIKSNSLRKKLILNGFKNIKRFDPKEIIAHHYKCYNQLLNKK